MSAIFFPLSAYFLLGLANIFDKFLVSKRIKQPAAYASVISLQNILILILLPFGVTFLRPLHTILAMTAGIFFTLALLCIFQAVQKNEASRVYSINGAVSPLITFGLAFLFIGERLSVFQLLAFALLLSGSFLMAGGILFRQAIKIGFFWIFLAAFFFACSFTMTKYFFDTYGFINGFFWVRLGSLGAAFGLLFFVKDLKKFFSSLKSARTGQRSTLSLLLISQIFGGAGFLLQNLAIFSYSVTLVSALQGLQYVFIFILTLILSYKFPKILNEDTSLPVVSQKAAGIVLIVLGIYFLF